MRNAIKKQFLVHRINFLWGYGLILTFSLFGGAAFNILTSLEVQPESYVTLGTLMGAMIAVMYTVVVVAVQIGNDFNMEVSMGCTRLHFLVSYYLVQFITCVGSVLLLMLICYAETSFYNALYPGIRNEVEIMPFLIKYGIFLAFADIALAGICGILMLRFGRKAMWTLWVIWMFTFLGLPRILEAADKAPDSIFGKIGLWMKGLILHFSMTEIFTGVAFLSIIAVVAAYLLIKKQQVTAA